MVFVKCKQSGIKVAKYGLVFNDEALEVSDEIAEKLVKEDLFEIAEGSKIKKENKESKPKKVKKIKLEDGDE